jgi:hypothetical protein
MKLDVLFLLCFVLSIIHCYLLSVSVFPRPSLYLHSDGILMLLYVDDISILYPEATAKAVIEVKVNSRRSIRSQTSISSACQFLGIEIHVHRNDPF